MEERVGSVLDNKSSRVYGYPLTIKQQIWCHYLIPGTSFLIGYVLNFSLDISVGIELFNEQKTKYGFLTILLLYLPALVCYFKQLVNLPSPRNCKTISLWLCKETLQLIFFPYRILKCLGVQLFWTIELIRGTEDEEESLRGFENSFDETAETQLFFQIFLQNIPQALLQFHMITIGTSSDNITDVTQAFCSLVSLGMAAQGVTRLHRYESQRIGGMKPIWNQSHPQTTISTQDQQENLLISKSTTPTGTLQLPRRNPRTKALEEDNPVGKLILFLFWFAFLFHRTLTIVTAMNFFPKSVISIIVVHIIIMFLYYLWYPITIYRKIFMALTSVFFIIEVGIRIKKIAYLYFLFIVSTLAENIGLTMLWYLWGKWHREYDDGWWYNYIIYVDINAHVISLILFALYLGLFKAKVKYLPPSRMFATSARSSIVL